MLAAGREVPFENLRTELTGGVAAIYNTVAFGALGINPSAFDTCLRANFGVKNVTCCLGANAPTGEYDAVIAVYFWGIFDEKIGIGAHYVSGVNEGGGMYRVYNLDNSASLYSINDMSRFLNSADRRCICFWGINF